MNADFASDFPSLEGMTYLNTAAACVAGTPQTKGVARYTRDARLGELGRRQRMYVIEEECRERVARLIGAQANEIAFLASSARALDAVIQCIDWRRGDNFVLNAHEFTTTHFAAMRLKHLGVEVRNVALTTEEPAWDRIGAAIDDRTRLLVVSAIDYTVGRRLPTRELEKIAHRYGALVLVDAAQALGAVEISVGDTDFMIAPTFKWMLGAYGVGILYARRSLHESLEPTYVGWRSVEEHLGAASAGEYELLPDARRFEEGTPNFPGLYVLREALAMLQDIGIATVERMTTNLASELHSALEALGMPLLTPRTASQRSGIVALSASRSTQIGAELDRRGVHVFAQQGRLRVSPHFYNDVDDIERLVDTLHTVTKHVAGAPN